MRTRFPESDSDAAERINVARHTDTQDAEPPGPSEVEDPSQRCLAEEPEPSGDDDGPDTRNAAAKPRGSRRAAVAGAVIVVVLGALTGWLGHRNADARQESELRELFVQTARQGAINLTTINYVEADADVKRILDSAVGRFYDDFQNRSEPFIDVVKQAKSSSVGTVNSAGLESRAGNQARVLVAVSVKTTLNGAPEEQPRLWRMFIDLQQSGETPKISNVEFVP